MKIFIKALIIITLSTCILSCDEEDLLTFDKELGLVDFESRVRAFSFMDSGQAIDTLSIKFLVHGLVSEIDREAKFTVVGDSTTINNSNFKIISSTVKANEDFGFVMIKLTKPDDIGDSDLRLYLRVVDNDNFKVGLETNIDCDITISNKLLPPSYWTPTGWITRYFLGSYSTAYYKFIIEETGYKDFPYPWVVPGVNNDEKWTYPQKKSFMVLLKSKVDAYNESISPDVFVHDDGLAKGLPVIPGKYYKQ